MIVAMDRFIELITSFRAFGVLPPRGDRCKGAADAAAYIRLRGHPRQTPASARRCSWCETATS
jgi:hypothetical protein